MRKRIAGRVGLTRGGQNTHFDYMAEHLDRMTIQPELLHFDDGRGELNLDPIFDWNQIYNTVAMTSAATEAAMKSSEA